MSQGVLLFVSPLVNLPLLRISGHTAHKCIRNNMVQPVQDDDPYVRKTAAVCVAKLHDINAELVEDRGFLDTLKVMLFAASASRHAYALYHIGSTAACSSLFLRVPICLCSFYVMTV